jgi:PrtD family type I secretion system ABC transporter
MTDTVETNVLKRILARYHGSFFVLGVFSFFYNILVLTLPIYMLSVFTHVLTSRSQETLVLLSLAAIAALLVQALLDYIRSQVLIRIGISLDTQLTPQVLEAVVRHAAGSPVRNGQRMRDVSELRGFLTGPSIFTLFDAPFVPIYVLVIYLMHPALGAIALIGSLMLFAIAWVNEWVTREPVKKVTSQSLRGQARVDEFVRNADAIEAMGMMPAVLKHWHGQNDDALATQSRLADRANISRSLAKFVRMALQIGLYGTGAYLYLHNQVMAGAIIASAILMGRALAPVETAINTWKSMVGAKDAYARLKAVLSEARLQPFRNRMSLPQPEGRLQLDRVVVTAPESERMTLKGIGFGLEPGEFLGVVGPSGAGKTTLAKLLVGIIAPKAGRASLDGVDLASWHPDQLGQYVGYLPQDVQLFSGTVRQNIARLDLDNDPEAVVEAAKMVGVHEMILQLPNGYDSDIGDYGALLSAGQRQHIALARAVYGNPCLLVLDEPNSNLDSVSEEALLKALDAAKKKGITLVVITHRPSILHAADKMMMLRNGAIEMFGNRSQVMAQISPTAAVRKMANPAQVPKNAPAPAPSIPSPKSTNAPILVAQGG